MKKEIFDLIRQRNFTLTRDLIPIHFSGAEGANFISPLPKYYKNALGDLELITNGCNKIKNEINHKTNKALTPFENILHGYEERTKEEQKKLLQNHFKISRVNIDQRGVYGVWAGKSVNSGDIYLREAK